jgi:hypothetical protein
MRTAGTIVPTACSNYGPNNMENKVEILDAVHANPLARLVLIGSHMKQAFLTEQFGMNCVESSWVLSTYNLYTVNGVYAKL